MAISTTYLTQGDHVAALHLSFRPTTRDPELAEGDCGGVEKSRERLPYEADAGSSTQTSFPERGALVSTSALQENAFDRHRRERHPRDFSTTPSVPFGKLRVPRSPLEMTGGCGIEVRRGHWDVPTKSWDVPVIFLGCPSGFIGTSHGTFPLNPLFVGTPPGGGTPPGENRAIRRSGDLVIR